LEEEVNNQLPFLDIQVTKLTNGMIRTMVFRKATNITPILHFRSNRPVGHKRSCVRTIFRRVRTHCSDDIRKKEEMEYLHALLTANGCPKSFIRKCLMKPQFERLSEEKPKFWLAIP
uniref:Helix-turn-helix domain-containing protein n=1 Tax=Schistocephalus solidus TaxID=70667 RepID=A0A183T377_SCHSO